MNAEVRRADDDFTEVWAEFKRNGDQGLRNRLIERYFYLVKVIGNRIAARLPRSIDVQDLRSAGVFGLIRAIENFDITRGTRFESYCATRVHGAILDELRAQDWVPRLVRNRADKYRKAFTALKQRLGRDPSTRELAEHTGSTDVEAEDLRRESNLTTVYTLAREDESSDDPHQVRKLDVLVDRDSEVPFDEMVTKDLAASFSTVLSLPERTVVALYYHDNLTMKEIGTVMRISESRVCQIHTRLLKKLEGHLKSIVEGTPSPAKIAAQAAAAKAAAPKVVKPKSGRTRAPSPAASRTALPTASFASAPLPPPPPL